jgi:ribosomal protein S18 acetylase RimI-like enzyme
MPQPFTIRRATRHDLPSLARLGGALVRMHHAFDGDRFVSLAPDPERRYGAFLADQMIRRDATVLVAEHDGQVVAYLFAAIEDASMKELRDEAGYIHDVMVDDSARRLGIAAALVEAATDWLRERGARRVLLWTAPRNEAAQRLFTRLGFRPTMVEMTREL